MPRMLLRASVLMLLWSAVPMHFVQAQEADDVVVVGKQEETGKKGLAAWWHRKVQGSRFGRSDNTAPTFPEAASEPTGTASVVMTMEPSETASSLHPISRTGGFGGPSPVSMGAVHPEEMLSGEPNVLPISEPGMAPMGAALYPSPRPGIPLNVGSTMITNQALAPHEMLYAHQYRSLYGPYYYKTKRAWVMTPFGIYKTEKRVLTGTQVRVKYHSHISPFSMFYP